MTTSSLTRFSEHGAEDRVCPNLLRLLGTSWLKTPQRLNTPWSRRYVKPREGRYLPWFLRCSNSQMRNESLLSGIEGSDPIKKNSNHLHPLSLCYASGKPHIRQHFALPSPDPWPLVPVSWISAGPCCSVPSFSSRFSLGNTKHKTWADGAISDDNQVLMAADWQIFRADLELLISLVVNFSLHPSNVTQTLNYSKSLLQLPQIRNFG